MSSGHLALLAVMLGAGFFVEAVAGFGGTVVAVSLGATQFPIAAVLAVFLPLNLVLSAYLAVRHRRAIAGQVLATRILPAMLVGLGIGTALALALEAERAKLGFAVLVVAIALRDLRRLAAPSPPSHRVLPPAAQLGVLGAAGIVHGLFATGGPLAVAVASRVLPGKATLRATLAVLWFTLNVLVVARLAADGHLGPTQLGYAAAVAPVLAVALAAGEWVHHRVSEAHFRWLVAGLLLTTGVVLLVRSWPA
ncbi:MAG: sulfite exporter TauE/SafE family protein [Kofleriaceae bacterium]